MTNERTKLHEELRQISQFSDDTFRMIKRRSEWISLHVKAQSKQEMHTKVSFENNLGDWQALLKLLNYSWEYML
jgi:hypothetical protein